MATGAQYGSRVGRSSRKTVAKIGPLNSELANLLYPIQSRDVVFLHDDFLLEEGTAITGSGLWVAGGINATNFAAPAAQLANGVVQGAIAANVADNKTLKGSAAWQGDLNCGMEIRWKVDNADTTLWEVGFVDPLTSFNDLALNDIDTPSITNGAADVALVAQDTGQTLTTMAFITDGSTSNFNTTKTNLGTRTPTNATYMSARVQIATNAARCWVFDENGALVEQAQHGDVTANSIEGGVLLHLWAGWETLATTAKTVDIDYVTAWQDRY